MLSRCRQRCGPVSRGSRAPTLPMPQSNDCTSLCELTKLLNQRTQSETEKRAGTHRRLCCQLQGARQRVRQHRPQPVRRLMSVLRPEGSSLASRASEHEHERGAEGKGLEPETPGYLKLEELPPDALARVMQVSPSCRGTALPRASATQAPLPPFGACSLLCTLCPRPATNAGQLMLSRLSLLIVLPTLLRPLPCACLQHLSVRDIHAALLASRGLNEALQDGAYGGCMAIWAACMQCRLCASWQQLAVHRGTAAGQAWEADQRGSQAGRRTAPPLLPLLPAAACRARVV